MNTTTINFTLSRIDSILESLKKLSTDYHTNSVDSYPYDVYKEYDAKNLVCLQAINYLSNIKTLKEIHPKIGYSGHERGINISLAAASMGICLIERHLTTDRSLEGPDHAASLTPDEFSQMVDGIREIEKSMGDGVRKISQGEMINRENLGKSLVSSKNLKKGTIININNSIFCRFWCFDVFKNF